MPSMEANTSAVPAFITKLWKLVEDHNYDQLIGWNESGKSFIIRDQSKFAKELLPLYFKHNNMASFIRQLNMYGFRKVANIENSGLRSERDDIEFFHQYFVRDQENALEFIKRKSSQIPSGKVASNAQNIKHENVSDMLSDIETIRGKQETVDSLLSNMQRENEALWREVAILRQKHHKQQQIVEKLIQFLVSLVQNRGLLGIKRKAQLMIDDSAENSLTRNNKVLKTNSCDFVSGDSCGPIIHEMPDDFDVMEASTNSPLVSLGNVSPNHQILSSEVNSSTTLPSNDNLLKDSPKSVEPLGILDPLQESIKELGLVADDPIEVSNAIDPNVDNAISVDSLLRSSLNTPPSSPSILKANTNVAEKQNDVKDLVISTLNNDQILPQDTADTLHDHVDDIEAELNWLQGQLTSGGLNIDSSTLMGVSDQNGINGLPIGLTENAWLKKLFSLDDLNTLQTPSNTFTNKYNSNDIIGNEIVQFNPNNTNLLFDDLDLDSINAAEDSQD